MKKCDGHKLCTKSRKVEFRSIFHKLKILVIPNVLAHGKSYEHNFMKKHDGHTLYKSHPRGKHGGAK
ncbi:hypothetical protein BHE74_00018739 [Ensete ventricosum]|nr:hypothetical protein BHE74_00018739 [Ensete ventricosum]